jgi:hypothetical protein
MSQASSLNEQPTRVSLWLYVLQYVGAVFLLMMIVVGVSTFFRFEAPLAMGVVSLYAGATIPM